MGFWTRVRLPSTPFFNEPTKSRTRWVLTPVYAIMLVGVEPIGAAFVDAIRDTAEMRCFYIARENFT